MYERRTEPLLPRRLFLRRVLAHTWVALSVIVLALAIGVLGYHLLEELSWLDALLNASMILGGMGPVDTLHTTAGKLFASFYALFAGLAFVAIAGIMVTPFAHRLLHRLHLGDDADTTGS